MAFTSGLAESELHLRGFSDDEEDEDSDSDLSPPSSAAAASEERTVRSSSAAGPGRGKGRERLRNNGKTTAARREVSEKGAAVGADADAVAAAAKATAAAAAAARARGSTTHGGGTVGRAATMAAKRKAANSALQELARVSNDGAGDDDSDEENDKDAVGKLSGGCTYGVRFPGLCQECESSTVKSREINDCESGRVGVCVVETQGLIGGRVLRAFALHGTF